MSETIQRAGEGAPPEDEASLLVRARRGERDALEGLVGRHVRDVFETAVRILGDVDLAQDATQDTFVNALGALSRFRGESSFRTWLLRIAVNAARNVSRRRYRRRELSLEGVADQASQEPDAAERVVTTSEVERVEGLLARLPEKQRLAVTLRLQQGLGYEEVAAILNCSQGAARVNYHLGLKRLREWMS